MKDHNISARTPDGIWLTGMADEYPYEAKVCDEASSFGIDCGRVIKLHIGGRHSSEEIAAYERGWDKYPCRAHTGLTRAVVRFCESLPRQEVWRHTFADTRRFLVTDDDVLEYEDD